MTLPQKTQKKKTLRYRVVSAPLILSWRTPRKSKVKESPPATLAPIYKNIPQELKARRHWVVWKLELKDGKWTKVPYNPNNPKYGAKSNNPKTWGTFEQARKIAEGNKEFAGIGYMFSKGCPYKDTEKCPHSKGSGCPAEGCPYHKFEGCLCSGVDLDHCRNPKTGEIEPWAWEIIKRFDSCTEVSPSGTGIKIFVEGQLPPGGRKKGNYENYSELRFFTVTGHHLEGTPTTIEKRQAELEVQHKEIFGKPQEPPKASKPEPLSNHIPTLKPDQEIIEKFETASNGEKFFRLMAGDFSAYRSQNEADMALCSMLAFYTQDPPQIFRIVQGSGLGRKKWDRPTAGSTYGMITIAKVLGSLTETYQWNRAGGNGNGRGTGRQTAQQAPGESKTKGESESKAPGRQDTRTLEPEAQAKTEAPQDPPQAGKPQTPETPKIIITKRFLDDKSHDGLKALETANHPPFLFRRSGSLARISLDEKDYPRIETITDIQLRGILARCAHFLKETEKGLVATVPPMDLVKDILALGEWNFPALEGIIQAPAMRIDGTVLNKPGYDLRPDFFM